MTDYRTYARHTARRHGIDPNVFERQIGVESNFDPNAKSPAGALGIAQFMPGTAAGLGVNPHNPREALDAAAQLMASYVKKYGSYRNALIAYNAGPGAVGGHLPAETQAYIAKILHGGEPQGGGTTTHIRPTGGGGSRTVRTPGFSALDPQKFAQAALMSGSKNPLVDAMSQALLGNLDTRVPGQRIRIATPHDPHLQGGHPPPGNVKVAPGANRPGVPLARDTLAFVGEVAGLAGHTLVIGTGSNHSRMTTSGNVSDHWDGHAADIPASGKALTKLGQQALIAAGMSPAKARKQQGGVYNLQHNGHRVQILFNTLVGGNHFTHLHVGVR